jgi:SNF2 family DNA or RNA helicase
MGTLMRSTPSSRQNTLPFKAATVAVDLDGTLAKHISAKKFDPTRIGPPVQKMMDKVKRYLERGKDVVLFTARASDPRNVPPVRAWLDRHNLSKVKITNQKTPDIEVIYDDRAKGVHKNKGTIKSGSAFDKLAALPGVSLKPHQQRVVNRLKQPGTTGLLAQHGLGSGKTLSSIASWDALGRPRTAVIVPAALQENYRKELTKWVGQVPPNVNIMSQQRVARQGGLLGPAPELMIVDEQHKAREQSSALRAALANIKAKKKLLLTGTPIYNHPQDIAATVNLAAGRTLLPTDRASFNERYVATEKVNPPLLQRLMGVRPGTKQVLKNRGELGRILRQYVDYHPNSTQGFPRSSEETIKVPMGGAQTDIYNAIMGKAPRWVRWKVKAGLPPGKGEFEAMRAFLTGARQVSNTNREFTRSKEEAAKIEAAFKFFQNKAKADPSYKAVVYSNYLRSGLSPYKDRLARAGIPYGEFSGDMDRRARDEMVRQYNANKLRALLISSAGAEGLDLKGTRLIQLLEPHFNEEKEKQIIGRGIRYGSHAGLSPAQQHVLVQRYLAQPQGGWFDRLFGNSTTRGADEYIRNLALQKSQLNNQVQQLLTP